MGGQARDWITGQQEEEDGKSHSRDKRDKAITQAITCVFCRDLHTTAVKRLNRYFCFLLLGFHLPDREKWAKMYKSII